MNKIPANKKDSKAIETRFKFKISFRLALFFLLSIIFWFYFTGRDYISNWRWETKNHYGPIVDCDSNLPINELVQCVKDKYVQMDDFYMNKIEKYDRRQQKQYSEGKYRTSKFFYFPDTYQNITYKTIPTFHSLKDCYEKYKCLGSSCRDGQGKYNYDEYKKEIAIRHYNAIELSRIGYDRRGGCDTKRFTTTVSRFENCGSFPIADLSTITYKYFTRSYPSPSKDLIIFENNGINVYAAFFEAVRLKDNKNLIAIRIFEFRPRTFADIIKEKGWLPNGKGGYQRIDPIRGGTEVISEELIKKQLFPYAAFTIWDIRDETIANMDKDFAISLDKRKNPTKIFINMGAKVYEIPVPGKEAN